MPEGTYRGMTGSEWLANGNNPGVCDRCDGCGQIADGEEAAAWWTWMTLPAQSQLAVVFGIVKPIDCPECNGTGNA